jgi:putative flippase GtrA
MILPLTGQDFFCTNVSLLKSWLSLPTFLMRNFIISIIDFFYPPFRRLMPLQTFRYAACGGGNVVLDICLYFISYNFIFRKQVVDFGFIAFKPHIAAFLVSFLVTMPVGFLLSKYVVWTESNMRGRIQLFRYSVIVATNILLNYGFIKLFVEQLHFYPTIAKIVTTAIVIVFSYLSQKHYTFKVKSGN